MATISTLQEARWETLFGTLPSTRLMPCMPRLPTTIRSAFWRSAISSSASAGSPVTVWDSTVDALYPRRRLRLLDHALDLGVGLTSQTFCAPSGAPTIFAPRSGS